MEIPEQYTGSGPFFRKASRYTTLDELQKASAELTLLYCGWEMCSPKYRYGPNERDSYVLHIIQSGKGTLEVDGEVYMLKAGDAFLLEPGLTAYYEADEWQPWQYMWVGFTGFKAKTYMENAGFADNNRIIKVNDIEVLEGYIDKMVNSNQSTYEGELLRNGNLMLLFADLIGAFQNKSGRKYSKTVYSDYVNKAVEYIESNYSKKIRIDALATHIGIHRSYLTTVFRRTVGCTPQEYLVNIRMQNAAILLKETNLPVNEISRNIGYPNQLAFSKVFKSIYGESPRKYRERNTENI